MCHKVTGYKHCKGGGAMHIIYNLILNMIQCYFDIKYKNTQDTCFKAGKTHVIK